MKNVKSEQQSSRFVIQSYDIFDMLLLDFVAFVHFRVNRKAQSVSNDQNHIERRGKINLVVKIVWPG